MDCLLRFITSLASNLEVDSFLSGVVCSDSVEEALPKRVASASLLSEEAGDPFT